VKLDLLSLDDVHHVVAVANTPTFLYRRLREDLSVDALSRSATANELYDYVESSSKKVGRTFEDTALIYAAAVALTFKKSGELRELIESRGIPKFRWLREIWEGHLTAAPRTSVIVVPAKYEATRQSSPSVVASSSSQTQSVQIKQDLRKTSASDTASNTLIIIPGGDHG
jgi:hypothetical protein